MKNRSFFSQKKPRFAGVFFAKKPLFLYNFFDLCYNKSRIRNKKALNSTAERKAHEHRRLDL